LFHRNICLVENVFKSSSGVPSERLNHPFESATNPMFLTEHRTITLCGAGYWFVRTRTKAETMQQRDIPPRCGSWQYLFIPTNIAGALHR